MHLLELSVFLGTQGFGSSSSSCSVRAEILQWSLLLSLSIAGRDWVWLTSCGKRVGLNGAGGKSVGWTGSDWVCIDCGKWL